MPLPSSRRLLGPVVAATALVALAACGAPVDEPAASGSASGSASATRLVRPRLAEDASPPAR